MLTLKNLNSLAKESLLIEPGNPEIYDSNLHAEVVVEGLELPTTMAFLGPNDMLVLEKEKGTVQRIVNGQNISQPLLDVNVAGSVERGMLGIAVSKDTPGHTYVFLYLYRSRIFRQRGYDSGQRTTR